VEERTEKLKFDQNPREYLVIAVDWVNYCDRSVYVCVTVGADTKQPGWFRISLHQLHKTQLFVGQVGRIVSTHRPRTVVVPVIRVFKKHDCKTFWLRSLVESLVTSKIRVFMITPNKTLFGSL
jgi:hypothetical protein